MICKKSLVLIIDTNILSDIIRKNKDKNFVKILEYWLIEIIQNVSCKTNGRIITFVVTTQVINDYKTGLSKEGFKKQSISLNTLFDLGIYIRNNLSTGDKKFSYVFHRLNLPKMRKKSVMSDKYDNKLLTLTQHVLSKERWNDRMVILASRDQKSIGELKIVLSKHDYSDNDGNLLFAKSITELEKWIRC